MFQLLLSAYSTITIRYLALFLGMTEDDATTCKLSLASSVLRFQLNHSYNETRLKKLSFGTILAMSQLSVSNYIFVCWIYTQMLWRKDGQWMQRLKW